MNLNVAPLFSVTVVLEILLLYDSAEMVFSLEVRVKSGSCGHGSEIPTPSEPNG